MPNPQNFLVAGVDLLGVAAIALSEPQVSGCRDRK